MLIYNQTIEDLRRRAAELSSWLLEHADFETSVDDFCKVANEYAIIKVKIHMIENN